jgi:ligand-binding sensor domain-containing protein
LSVLETNTQNRYTFSAGLAGNVVKSLYIDATGTKWFGTNEGISAFDGTSWINYGTGGFLASTSINDIWIDEADTKMVFWVATQDGLSTADFIPGGFSNPATYTQSDGLLANNIVSLGRDNLGTQYAASADGINYLSNNVWKTIKYSSFPASIPNAPVKTIHVHKDSLYVGTSGGIGRFVNTVDGITGATRWTSEYGISPLSGDITAVFVDSKGNQWFGTSVGLQKHEGLYAKSGWSLYTETEGLVNNYILSVNESASHDIWVATKGGVSILKNEAWQSLHRKDGLVCDTVYDIAFEKDGSAWLATHNGVSHYKSGEFENYFTGIRAIKNNLPLRITCNQKDDLVQFTFDLTVSQPVTITIYSISGQALAKIGGKMLPAGKNVLEWKFSSQNQKAKQGIYVYQFTSRTMITSDKFILLH